MRMKRRLTNLSTGVSAGNCTCKLLGHLLQGTPDGISGQFKSAIKNYIEMIKFSYAEFVENVREGCSGSTERLTNSGYRHAIDFRPSQNSKLVENLTFLENDHEYSRVVWGEIPNRIFRLNCNPKGSQ